MVNYFGNYVEDFLTDLINPSQIELFIEPTKNPFEREVFNLIGNLETLENEKNFQDEFEDDE